MYGTDWVRERESKRKNDLTWVSWRQCIISQKILCWALKKVYWIVFLFTNARTHALYCIKTSTIEHYACLGHKYIKYIQFDTNRDTWIDQINGNDQFPGNLHITICIFINYYLSFSFASVFAWLDFILFRRWPALYSLICSKYNYLLCGK